MKVLFLSHNFVPESNAPAARLHEHGVLWAKKGMDLTVVTCPPHFPEGKIYDGYRNGVAEESMDGINVVRVPIVVARNKGRIRRSLSFLSYAISTIRWARSTDYRPDIVVATIPQLFAGWAGRIVARRFNVPFVLEVRDLWPESITAVGIGQRGMIIDGLERLAKTLYHSASHVVVVTKSFKQTLTKFGTDPSKISVVMNGVNDEFFNEPPSAEEIAAKKSQLGLDGKFVITYIGTMGLAQQLSVLVEAAKDLQDTNVHFLVAGEGADRENVVSQAKELGLENFSYIGKIPRREVPVHYYVADVAVVHLRDDQAFTQVLPSKLFEAMAFRRPVLLGVRGEARETLLAARCGCVFTPQSSQELVDCIRMLLDDPDQCVRLGENGYRYALENNSRTALANQYYDILLKVAGQSPAPHANQSESSQMPVAT